MDLRRRPPRSPREQLAGYVHLPRMSDKCRASLQNAHGDYIYPCPMDQRLLDFAGISAQEFSATVQRIQTDEDLGEWFQKAGKPHSEAEREDLNRILLTCGPDTPEKWTSFKRTRDAIDPSRVDIVSWADLLDLEEGRPVPRRESTAEPTRTPRLPS